MINIDILYTYVYIYIYTHVYVIKGILVRNFSVNLELLHEIIHEKK